MPHSLARVFIHIVFCTKYRAPVICERVEQALHAYLAGICRQDDSPAIRIGGAEDHVHLLCELSRKIPICDLVEDLKKGSSKWLKTQGDSCRSFSWQGGYWASSVSPNDVPRVKRYIENQKRHHRKKTFGEECRELEKIGWVRNPEPVRNRKNPRAG